MPDGPLVSILTPSLNQGQWLDDNLRSVAEQTYPRIEHLVMDGGSTDATLALLNNADDHVAWWSEQDRGQSHALNKAFARSNGSIIGWLNADDAYFDMHVVARVIRAFEGDRTVDVVYGHAALINDAGLVLHYLWVPPFAQWLLDRHNFIVQPSVFIRRSVLGDAFVDESFEYAMDRDLWLRLSRIVRFRRLDTVLAADRHHATRKSYVRTDLQERDRRQLHERYGVPLPQRRALRNKLMKVAIRGLGLSLVFRSVPDLAFRGHLDGRAHLLRRQVAQVRARMPVGSST